MDDVVIMKKKQRRENEDEDATRWKPNIEDGQREAVPFNEGNRDVWDCWEIGCQETTRGTGHSGGQPQSAGDAIEW